MTRDAAPDHVERTTSRGLARRNLIVTTATDLFLEQGYDAVTVDEIIRVVGGSKTNLYKHFGGKEGLFSEVVEQLCHDFLQPLSVLEVSSLRPADGLRVLGSTLLKMLMADRHVAFQRLMLAVSGRFPDLTGVWFESGPVQSRKALANFIASKQSTGEMREADPHMLAIQYHDMIVTNPLYLALMGKKPSPAEIERSIDNAIATFLLGQLPRAN
ncbi:TetR/AcrR family transcriptional regulator [Rhizobium daejeonense]|uniref:TetR/AcrR family transcriptional regulator n=1 Tax=Rhizobium daejeonense TaxID=240521 RepID=A0A6M1RM29_9HYPH|nr:TetR/AcrR family transcriptional regulator [Rhizobium daejeonense]NGO62312.1 TetR/AcrR family transcriptional regulator [Rhizobium daejeonense]